eukprot:793437-Amphidinium_carterae.1
MSYMLRLSGRPVSWTIGVEVFVALPTRERRPAPPVERPLPCAVSSAAQVLSFNFCSFNLGNNVNSFNLANNVKDALCNCIVSYYKGTSRAPRWVGLQSCELRNFVKS